MMQVYRHALLAAAASWLGVFQGNARLKGKDPNNKQETRIERQ
jgi:hypothetical protein